MTNPKAVTVTVNNRDYQMPARPVVAICVDGSEPAYIEEAVAAGVMPWTERIVGGDGTDLRVNCVIPSFTNPNNLSIVTGAPPAVHGICGNYFYDRMHEREVMMNAPELLRAQTLFEAFQKSGLRIGVVTAKDKLRRLLGARLTYGNTASVCFSELRDLLIDRSQRIDPHRRATSDCQCTLPQNPPTSSHIGAHLLRPEPETSYA